MAGLGFGGLALGLHVLLPGTPGWLVTGMAVVGAFSVVGGLRRLVRQGEERRQARLEAQERQRLEDTERRDSLEKTVLQIAHRHGGVVTPALVVLESHLQLAEAETVLQALCARGYAELRVKDNGTLDYRFPDLE